jgi:peptide/nickel transport system substrate-binding protein
MTREPFDDVRVRQAIALAVNREDISERVFLGYFVPNFGTAPKGWAYNPDAEIEYNLEQAMALLDEAGLTPDADGVRLRATITVASVMSFPDVVTVMQEQLRQIGVELEIETMDFAAYTAKVTENRDFDIAGGGGLAGPDPNEFAPFVTSDGYRNIMGYANARVDELFDAGRQTANQDERAAFYQEIQGILIEDMPRVVVLDSVSAFPHWCEVENPYFAEELIGKPGNQDYSFLYTYLAEEQ